MNNRDRLFPLLDEFMIEVPSWGFADTGTRFGKFTQPAAASTIDEKLYDAGLVHKYTACCPTVAVHVLWDFSVGVDASATADIAKKNGVRIGSINPNLFQDQVYKFGSGFESQRTGPESRPIGTFRIPSRSPKPSEAKRSVSGSPTARITPVRTISRLEKVECRGRCGNGTMRCRAT